MKLFRKWHGLALALIVITTLALSSSAFAQETVQLTFRQFDPPTEIDGLIAAVDAWNASHPNIQVKLETLGGGDTLAQLAREVPAGAGPDVQQMAFVWTRDLARSDLVLELGPADRRLGAGRRHRRFPRDRTRDARRQDLRPAVDGRHVLDGLPPGSARSGRHQDLPRHLG